MTAMRCFHHLRWFLLLLRASDFRASGFRAFRASGLSGLSGLPGFPGFPGFRAFRAFRASGLSGLPGFPGFRASGLSPLLPLPFSSPSAFPPASVRLPRPHPRRGITHGHHHHTTHLDGALRRGT